MYYYLIHISYFLQLLLLFSFKYKIIIMNKCKYSIIQKFFYLNNNIFQLILILKLSLFLVISSIKNIFTYIMKTELHIYIKLFRILILT